MKKTITYSTENERWQAVANRDESAKDAFIYGVKTTKIYCRPGCASRTPRRENVQFFDSSHEAEAASFRPCKRCQPQDETIRDSSLQAVISACQMIENAETEPSLTELAESVSLSSYHFQRLFKKTMGITPKQFAQEIRKQRLQGNLQEGKSITTAIFASGYTSGSRFYEKAAEILGMKPLEYQKGAPGLRIRYAVGQSWLGKVLVAQTEKGICRIDIGKDEDALEKRLREQFPLAKLSKNDAEMNETLGKTLAFLETPQKSLELPLDIQGTAFQQRVWQALRNIPAGKTLSYSDVAREIGKPKAVRAVASACAANKIAVAIPCHRVLRSDGGLGGYRWGLERKAALLEREV